MSAFDAELEAAETLIGLAVQRIAKVRQAIARTEQAPLDRCAAIAPDACAMRNEDARLERRSFEAPNGWQCRGCGHRGGEPLTAGG